jgi:hypothetical protein
MMKKRQKSLLMESATVLGFTIIAMVAMINVKDWINRREAIRAMEHLGQKILAYRQEHGSVPPEDYVRRIKQTLPGHVRLGKLKYRALWIDFDSTPDEILAYSFKKLRSPFLPNGYIVLHLDGRIQWMKPALFKELLRSQQSEEEIVATQEEEK